MIQITPEEEITLAQDRLASLSRVISDLRKQVEALKQDAETGGKIDSGQTKTTLSQFNAMVVACTNAEMKLDECRSKQTGIARGGYALDMDKARAEIGCKLDQLRACHDSGDVSE